jgi:hypothetical protein
LQLDFRHLLQEFGVPRLDAQSPFECDSRAVVIAGSFRFLGFREQGLHRGILQWVHLYTLALLLGGLPDLAIYVRAAWRAAVARRWWRARTGAEQ